MRLWKRLCTIAILLALVALTQPGDVLAQDAMESNASAAEITAGTNDATSDPAGLTDSQIINSPIAAHNAWMLVCCALVLFMTAPGLAMFYGGLVRRKNVLSVMMQCIFL